MAKWTWAGTNELSKTYEFRDPQTATRFRNQVMDLSLKVNDTPFSLVVDKSSANVALPLSGGVGSAPTDREVNVAQALDDIGAELQLGGKWN